MGQRVGLTRDGEHGRRWRDERKALVTPMIPLQVLLICMTRVHYSLSVTRGNKLRLLVSGSWFRQNPDCLPACSQDKYDWQGGGLESQKPLLSYGPCQFPTLGLIVQRAW